MKLSDEVRKCAGYELFPEEKHFLEDWADKIQALEQELELCNTSRLALLHSGEDITKQIQTLEQDNKKIWDKYISLQRQVFGDDAQDYLDRIAALEQENERLQEELKLAKAFIHWKSLEAEHARYGG